MRISSAEKGRYREENGVDHVPKRIRDRKEYNKARYHMNKEKHKDNLRANWIERPWLKTLCNVRSRCLNKGHEYFKRGIKNLLTAEDVKNLWIRDKAHLLAHPSIDRKEGSKDYTFDNCRFIELADNKRREKCSKN